MKFAANGDVRIAYDVQGAGPPLVLLHANPFDHRLWLYQSARWAERFRLLNLDLRGYGRSDKPERAFTLRDMADDVLAVVRAEGIARAIFVGCSVGANLSLLLALDDPAVTAAIVMVGGGARGTPRFAERIAGYERDADTYRKEHLRQLVAPGFAEGPLGAWLLDLFVAPPGTLSGACIAQIFRALTAFDARARLPGLTVPTLLVNGEHDALAIPLSREIGTAVRGAQQGVIPGTGHACCLEDPAAFDRIVVPFIDAHRT